MYVVISKRNDCLLLTLQTVLRIRIISHAIVTYPVSF